MTPGKFAASHVNEATYRFAMVVKFTDVRIPVSDPMAFTEFEIVQHMKVLEDCFWSRHRPPLHVREQMRDGQRFTD